MPKNVRRLKCNKLLAGCNFFFKTDMQKGLFPIFPHLSEQNKCRKLVMFTKMWDLVMQKVTKSTFLSYPHDNNSLVFTVPFLNPGDTPEHERLTASKKFGI